MPEDKDIEELEDRGDDFVPPGMETEDPEDEEFEDLDDIDEDEDEDPDSDDEDQDSDDDDDDEDQDDPDEDSDDESDDDDEEEDEEDPEDDEDDDEEQRIPKGRLNQVLRQRDEEREHRKWLEEQLETLIKAQGKADQEQEEEDEGPPDYDFDAAEERYIELVLEGSVKDASKLRKEINAASQEVYEYQIESAKKAAKSEAVTETTSSLDEVRFNSLIGQYQEEHPFLDDESDAYNGQAVAMTNKLMGSYMAEGKTKSQALTAAVNDIVPLFEKAEDPAPKVKKGKKKAEVRKRTARKKAAKASRQQPPDTKGAKGKQNRKFTADDVAKMPEKVFNSLTQKEKAKLRGDIL